MAGVSDFTILGSDFAGLRLPFGNHGSHHIMDTLRGYSVTLVTFVLSVTSVTLKSVMWDAIPLLGPHLREHTPAGNATGDNCLPEYYCPEGIVASVVCPSGAFSASSDFPDVANGQPSTVSRLCDTCSLEVLVVSCSFG